MGSEDHATFSLLCLSLTSAPSQIEWVPTSNTIHNIQTNVRERERELKYLKNQGLSSTSDKEIFKKLRCSNVLELE